MSFLVDTCVLLDVLTEDPVWFERSSQALMKAADAGPIVTNAVIYAEVSPHFATKEEIDIWLNEEFFDLQPLSREAAFLASRCFTTYKKRGGMKTSCLPDFFIGAHAATAGLPLVTRDVGRFREYFPTLRIVVP